MRIGIDFDNTIADSPRAIFEIFKKETNQPTIEFTENYGWDFEGLLPREYVSRALELFKEKEFTDLLEPFPVALTTIRALHEAGHEIIICSKHCEERKLHTLVWINKHLPFCKVIFTDSFDKSCLADKVDIFIDDKIECLESLEGKVPYLVCYGDYQWNREWRNQGRLCADNWFEVLYEIQTIEGIEQRK